MLEEALKYLWPLLVVQVGLQVIAFISLSKRQKVRFDNKVVWVLIILFGGLFGSIGYFVFRGEEDASCSED